jgi:putative ABC transport system substrate-binding protein
MKRREFITLLGGAAVAWPLAARAQQATMPVVALINAGAADANARRVAAFRKGLSEAGYLEGQNVTVDYHWLEGQYSRLPSLMVDVVHRRVAVIATPSGNLAAQAAKAATTAIPIVFSVGEDPVKLGLVATLARPGGNTTGLASALHEITAKQVDLLVTAVPNLSRVALLSNPANSANAIVFKIDEGATLQAGISLLPARAQNVQDIESVFEALTRERVDAIIVSVDGFFLARRQRIAELALRNRLPSIFGNREYAEAGGLMSYGESIREFSRRAATFVDKIFKGAKPSDLPIEQPTKFNLVINRKTADALGIAIPASLYIFADEVIE